MLEEEIVGIRQFSPVEADFDPPLEITIQYSEDQLVGLDPESITVEVIDPVTGSPIPGFVLTNIINTPAAGNIKFSTTSFGVSSTRGGPLVPLTIVITGAKGAGPLPASTPPWLGVLAALMLAAGALSIALHRRNAE